MDTRLICVKYGTSMQQDLPHLAVQDESSLAGHLGERAPRTADDEDEGADVAEEEAVDVPEDADEAASGKWEPSPHLFFCCLSWELYSQCRIPGSLLSVLEAASMTRYQQFHRM